MRLLICVFILLIYSCSKVEEIGPDKNLILAKVADKYITIQDFIQRSEYTIRPDYCKKSNYIHKKIILNSLIAEKMIALEMENRFEDTYKSKFFDYFIKGKKRTSHAPITLIMIFLIKPLSMMKLLKSIIIMLGGR